MTTPETAASAREWQRMARDHLWLHFTRMGEYARGARPPIIVRGDGCYLEDADGRRYLDALAGLFAVQIGYSFGDEVGEAAAAQMRELPFYTNWSYAHPRALELAAEVASLAPGDLNRVFFVSGGSEAVESAWKLARQYHAARGERRWKVIARNVAYHGTTMGALSINGIPALRTPYEPLVPEVRHVRNTNRYHRPAGETEEEFTAFLLDDLEHTIDAAGPETVAMVIMEPVQNAGGAFTPPAGYFAGRARALRRVRHPPLRGRGDHRLRPRRALVRLGALRRPPRPRHLRQGAVLGVRRDRRGRRARRRHGAVPRGLRSFSHGITFGGHPVQAAIALKNIEIMKREGIVEHVREHEDAVPLDARAAARPADRRRPAGRRLLLRAGARQGQGDSQRPSRTTSPRRSCAASSHRGCSNAG